MCMEIKLHSRIFYPSHGAGYVTGVRSIEFGGQNLNYYDISFIDSDIKVSAPMANIGNLGVRHVEAPDKLIDAAKALKDTPKTKPKTADYNEFIEVVKQLDNEGKIENFVSIVRMCNYIKGQREKEGKLIPVSINKYIRSSLNHLVGELAVSSDQPLDQAKAEFETVSGMPVK